MTSLTIEACKPTGAKPRDAERSKNFFALGLLSWLYHRPIDDTERWIVRRYGRLPIVVEANTLAFRAGYNFGETAEIFESSYEIAPAEHLPGTYTNVTGNVALAWGLLAAAHLAKLPAVPRLLPDHAGVGHLARALQAQELRRPDPAGRRRDRRHRCGARSGLRRAPSG